MLTIINIIKVLLIFSLFLYVLQRKDKDYLLKIAFLFTFASDVILAFATDSDRDFSKFEYGEGGVNLLLLGTMIFCFAQLAYFARHCPRKTLLKIYLPLTTAIIIATFIPTLIIVGGPTPCLDKSDPNCLLQGYSSPHPLFSPSLALVFYAVIYALTEIFNLIFTIKQNRRTALGFALFIACDLVIACGFVTAIGLVNLIPQATADWLCWVFYLPAQILLAISPKPVLK